MYRGNGRLAGGILWSRSSNSAQPWATCSWTLPWGCVKIASSSQIRRTHRVTQLARAKITALGTYVPPRLLTNDDLEKMVETSNDWIVDRTGIRERHIAGTGVATSRSEEHTSELQSPYDLVCRLLLEKKKKQYKNTRKQTHNNNQTHSKH